MIDVIKKALRITHNALDDEIGIYIDACKIDLLKSGIRNLDDGDSAIKTMLILYAKWQFNFEEEGERYEKAYKEMRAAFAIVPEYRVAPLSDDKAESEEV